MLILTTYDIPVYHLYSTDLTQIQQVTYFGLQQSVLSLFGFNNVYFFETTYAS